MPPRVGEIEGGPIPVIESTPYRVVVINRDRVCDPQLLQGPADVTEVFLERELGRVHADQRQPSAPVLLGPRADVGERAQPVDAGVGAELEEDDLSAQGAGRQRLRVEPRVRAAEGGQPAFIRQSTRRGRRPTPPAAGRAERDGGDGHGPGGKKASAIMSEHFGHSVTPNCVQSGHPSVV